MSRRPPAAPRPRTKRPPGPERAPQGNVVRPGADRDEVLYPPLPTSPPLSPTPDPSCAACWLVAPLVALAARWREEADRADTVGEVVACERHAREVLGMCGRDG